jgi:16S rRNA (uracil1498-N3)-methyltransferase
VGPEGGFTDREFASATSAGWSAATLGPRILRADTAAVAALTLVLVRAGEMER